MCRETYLSVNSKRTTSRHMFNCFLGHTYDCCPTHLSHTYTHTSLPSHHDPLFQNANHTLLFCLAIFLLCANIWLNKIYDPGT